MDIKNNNDNYSSFLTMTLSLCGFFCHHTFSYLHAFFSLCIFFKYAVPIAWKTFLQANFHLSFKTQIRFTPILELSTPFSVLLSYSWYILVLSQMSNYAIVLHTHLPYLTMSRGCPCWQLLAYASPVPVCVCVCIHIYLYLSICLYACVCMAIFICLA